MTTSPRVYVGTYAKYNDGSIKGAWLDLADYADKDAFYEACSELHADESDPEFMFQDHEGIPDGMITESSISDDVWEFMGYEDWEQDAILAYRYGVSEGDDIEHILECFQGTADSAEAYAMQYAEDIGMLSGLDEGLHCYFDFEAFARDMFMSDLCGVEYEGTLYVFDNN